MNETEKETQQPTPLNDYLSSAIGQKRPAKAIMVKNRFQDSVEVIAA